MEQEFTEKAGNTYSKEFHKIETQAQQWWKDERPYASSDMPDHANKRYILGMFPYPSGNAHMGHVRVYSITDMIARHARFKGHDVLHPLGWDSFGLPAENAAIKNNVHPENWTNTNIATMRDEQIGKVGFSFDLDRELITSSPEYYKWTQWLFLKLYERGKVYRSLEWVNWDPIDQTVLANEQVIDGKGWRSGTPIERRQMEQWYIRITDYAEELAQGIESLEGWSEAAKGAQRNWIGRAEGALINFLAAGGKVLRAFTIRPELSYGISAIVVAPENKDVLGMCTNDQRLLVQEYIKKGLLKSEVNRASNKQPDGIFTGVFVDHPLTKEQIPVYVADYVLNTYANGIAVCIPAHNERDYQFAQAMKLPIKAVLSLPSQRNMADGKVDGTLTNSGFLDGLSTTQAREIIIEQMERDEIGQRKIEYRLRDWSLSRQRFWGSPIPMLKDQMGKWTPVPEEQLPVMLPQDMDFRTIKGGSPLATRQDFYEVTDPTTGQVFLRETDTMDTFMCSAWYAWRFTDPKNTSQAWASEKGNAWMPIDTYVGGLEHANQHMIYFRFMAHFLHDIGLSATKEPIRTFLDNGLVRMDGEKMSKSKGNIVRPDEMVEKYGADALRMYILSDLPLNRDIEWDENGVSKKFDFLRRVNGLCMSYAMDAPRGVVSLVSDDVKDSWSIDLLTKLKETAERIDDDIEKTHNLHNVVARSHELANVLFAGKNSLTTPERAKVYAFTMQNYLKILGLSAPHLADTLYRCTFLIKDGLFTQPWVSVSPDLLDQKEIEIEVPVAVNGRKQTTVLSISQAKSNNEISDLVRGCDDKKLKDSFGDTSISKIIVVRDPKTNAPKLVNIVLEK